MTPLTSFGIWAMVALALYCAACETVQVLYYKGMRADVDRIGQWTEERIADVHTRLDRAGAPGIHPNSDGPTVAYPPSPEEPATVVFESTPLADSIFAIDGLPTLDQATPEQQADPTRPDFRALPRLHRAECDALLPVPPYAERRRCNCDGLTTEAESYGRHAAAAPA